MFKGHVPKGVGVQVPLRPPLKKPGNSPGFFVHGGQQPAPALPPIRLQAERLDALDASHQRILAQTEP